MDEKFLESDKIVQTWDNQKNWQYLGSRLTMRVGPIKEILQFSFTGGVNRYLSKGNTYTHTYTNWYTNASASATYKNVNLTLGINTSWNWFYGETMNGGENIHYAMIKYNYKNLSLGVGMMNPFADNFKVEMENRSQYAAYKKSNYINESSRMLMFQLSYNFSFGRKYESSGKRLNNTDDDTGVMNTGK